MSSEAGFMHKSCWVRLCLYSIQHGYEMFAWLHISYCVNFLQLTFMYGRDTIRDVVDRLLDDHQAALDAQRSDSVSQADAVVYESSQNGSAHLNGNAPAQNGHNISHSPANGIEASNNLKEEQHSGKVGTNGLTEPDSSREREANGNSHVPEIRKGVKPGSFIDLLVRGSMRETGDQFTRNEKAQQVGSWLSFALCQTCKMLLMVSAFGIASCVTDLCKCRAMFLWTQHILSMLVA